MRPSDRARAYLAKMTPAIAGQGGHLQTFKAACRLVEFGLSEGEALSILADWNQSHCQPPWTEADLRHKLADAYKATSPKPELSSDGQSNRVAARPPAATRSPIQRPDANRLPVLPFLTPGTPDQLAALARLRGLAPEAVCLASSRGLLRFAVFKGAPAWLILDKTRRNAQARRLDGRPWAQGVKAWTLPGSRAAWPIGAEEAKPFPIVALCEGGPDLLAAFHFILTEGRAGDVAPVTILGAACRLPEEALPLFRGKRVRLFPHLDAAGDRATDRWAADLAKAGAAVDGFSLAELHKSDGSPVNDLNDLAAIHPDDFEAHDCLRHLFP